jgi:hypothetical protein
MQIQYTGVAYWPTCKKTDSPHIKNAINDLKKPPGDISNQGVWRQKKERGP